MKKIHYANKRRIDKVGFSLDTDIQQIIDSFHIIFKTVEINDLRLQRSMIDFQIIKLVSFFESNIKDSASYAFSIIKEWNEYDLESIQIPISSLREMTDDIELTPSDIFVSSFNFQNPHNVKIFFSKILKIDLFDSFRKFIEYNPNFTKNYFDFNPKEGSDYPYHIDVQKFMNPIIENIFYNQKNTNNSIDEFIEIFEIRNKISHDPNYSSVISIEYLCKMFIFNLVFQNFILFCIEKKASLIYHDKELDEKLDSLKMDKIFSINNEK